MCGKGWLPPYCSARSGNSWFHLKNETAGIDCSSACRGELNELAFPYAAGLNGEVYILLVPLKEYQSRRHTSSVLNNVLLAFRSTPTAPPPAMARSGLPSPF